MLPTAAMILRDALISRAETIAAVIPMFLVFFVIILEKRNAAKLDLERYQEGVAGSPEFSGKVLTLVHGTWGRGIFWPIGDAAWTVDGSILCSLLRERFGQHIVFRRFRWSGGNTHTARMRAAKELRAYLHENLERWPKGDHFVIAHSHGGNVALYATGTPQLRDRIAGIVCFSTPFILVRERDLGVDRTDLFQISIVVILYGIFFIAMMQVGVAGWLGRILMVACAMILTLGVFGLLPPLYLRSALARAKIIYDELSPSLPRPNQLMIVRSPADEASGAIGVFQFISQLTMRMFYFLESMQASMDRLVRHGADLGTKSWKLIFIIGAVSAGALSITTYAAYAQNDAQTGVVLMIAIAAIISFVCFAVCMAMLAWALCLKVPGGARFMARNSMLIIGELILAVTAILSLLLALPFGWQVAVANFFLDVAVDATPLGTWELNLVNPPKTQSHGISAPPLEHSVHSNPEAVRLLGDWIEGRSNRRTIGNMDLLVQKF